jgi:predicted DNA-binding transcriptional regulator AlpA
MTTEDRPEASSRCDEAMIKRPVYVDPKGWEALTGISKSTWAKRRRTGDTPPFIKLGKSVRYPVRAGLDWLARRQRQYALRTEDKLANGVRNLASNQNEQPCVSLPSSANSGHRQGKELAHSAYAGSESAAEPSPSSHYQDRRLTPGKPAGKLSARAPVHPGLDDRPSSLTPFVGEAEQAPVDLQSTEKNNGGEGAS